MEVKSERKRQSRFENGGSAKKIKVEEDTTSDTKPIDKSMKREKIDTNDSRKKVKIEVDGPDLDSIKNTGAMPDAAKVNELMAQAQKMIEERKKKLNIAPSKINPAQAEQFMVESLQLKSSRLDYLRNRVKASLNNLPVSLSNYQSFEKQQGAPKPLILDETGRTIDNRGHQIQLTQRTPTLKANIRAEKVANFNRAAQEVIQETYENRDEYAAAAYVDQRVPVKAAVREKRKLKFHQPGEFIAQAKKLRAQAKLEKLQQEVSLAAKRTGISSAVKLAMVAPKVAELTDTDVPNIEWWDSVILPGDYYPENLEEIKTEIMSDLVEHPIQLRPPGESDKPIPLKVHLTSKERKKLRRQNRKEMQREKQEKYRLGLEPAPEPKVKISNLMRVLGTSAIQDPTKMEAHVREQMAKRLKKHEDDNLARKLTPEQRAAKKAKKFHDDNASGVQVSVYRVRDLSHPAKQFKVQMNAKQLSMTGTCVLHKDVNVVVVEGGAKQQKFFKQLMLKRIKWTDERKTAAAESSGSSSTPKNKCDLVWEGTVKKRNFGELKCKPYPLEKLVRELFQKHNVEHYWDSAYSGAVLEQSDDI